MSHVTLFHPSICLANPGTFSSATVMFFFVHSSLWNSFPSTTMANKYSQLSHIYGCRCYFYFLQLLQSQKKTMGSPKNCSRGLKIGKPNSIFSYKNINIFFKVYDQSLTCVSTIIFF